MLTIVEILGSVSSILLLFLYIRSFLRLKESYKKWHLAVFLTVFAVILSAINLFPNLVVPRVCCLIAGCFCLCYFFFASSPWQSLFMGISLEVVAALVEVGVMGILGLFHFDAAMLMSNSNMRMVFIVTTQLTLLPILVFVGTFGNEQEGLLPLKWLIPLFPCQLLSVFVCYIVLRNAVRDSFDSFLIFVLLTLLYINITIVFYAEAMRASEHRRRHSELAEQQYAMQKEYYQRLHESQEETRALWHDIKKYVLAMQAFANQKDAPQLCQIVQQADETLASISTVVDVDNVVISSILDNYARAAQEAEIPLHLDVLVPPTLSISPVDLYIILGNTLDNAIEACTPLPKEQRRIDVMLRKENAILFYRIQNSCDVGEKVHLHGRYHGYGLNNVRKCAARYNGVVNLTKTSNSYTVEVLLNCKC